VKLGGGAQCARHSGRGGEERGARMSAVELAGGGGTFYRAEEAVGRRGEVLIPVSFEGVKGEEETGRHHFSGGVKVAGWRFGSALQSAVHDVAAPAKGGGGSGVRRWKTPLSWAKLLGRKAAWAYRPTWPVQGF
jgi:hypothetical protein